LPPGAENKYLWLFLLMLNLSMVEVSPGVSNNPPYQRFQEDVLYLTCAAAASMRFFHFFGKNYKFTIV